MKPNNPTQQLIEKLRELRRQAGYEANAWYEQKEEELLEAVAQGARESERERIINSLDAKIVEAQEDDLTTYAKVLISIKNIALEELEPHTVGYDKDKNVLDRISKEDE